MSRSNVSCLWTKLGQNFTVTMRITWKSSKLSTKWLNRSQFALCSLSLKSLSDKILERSKGYFIGQELLFHQTAAPPDGTQTALPCCSSILAATWAEDICQTKSKYMSFRKKIFLSNRYEIFCLLISLIESPEHTLAWGCCPLEQSQRSDVGSRLQGARLFPEDKRNIIMNVEKWAFANHFNWVYKQFVQRGELNL